MEETMNEPVVWYDIGVETPVLPADPLPAPPPIPPGALVIITGRAPIWRYARAWHAVHGRAAAVATFDPRLGAVIVASHTPRHREGDVLPLSPPAP